MGPGNGSESQSANIFMLKKIRSLRSSLLALFPILSRFSVSERNLSLAQSKDL